MHVHLAGRIQGNGGYFVPVCCVWTQQTWCWSVGCLWGITHSRVWYAAFMCVTWMIHVCDMNHSCVCHESFTCVRRADPVVASVVWRIYIHMCDMTHSYVWHDSFIRVTWLIYVCDITHSYVWHDSFTSVVWRIYACDTTRSYVWHDITHSYVWHDTCTCAMCRVMECIHMCHIMRYNAW